MTSPPSTMWQDDCQVLGPDNLPQDTEIPPPEDTGDNPRVHTAPAPPGNGPVLCEYQVEGAVTPN